MHIKIKRDESIPDRKLPRTCPCQCSSMDLKTNLSIINLSFLMEVQCEDVLG